MKLDRRYDKGLFIQHASRIKKLGVVSEKFGTFMKSYIKQETQIEAAQNMANFIKSDLHRVQQAVGHKKSEDVTKLADKESLQNAELDLENNEKLMGQHTAKLKSIVSNVISYLNEYEFKMDN